MFIYKQLFTTYKLKDIKYNDTKELVNKLCIDAEYNKINGPEDLSNRLQKIIDSIPK